MSNESNIKYPLVNKQLDPENSQFLMETSLPTPMTARVYVNLPEGINHRDFEDQPSQHQAFMNTDGMVP